jgi:hypothetical protein
MPLEQKRKARPSSPAPFPMDPAAKAYFNRGASDARANKKFKPPAANNPEYPYGYLNGIIWREYRAKVDWARVFKDVLDKETFEDELAKRPARRPRLLAKRLRDVCVKIEIINLIARNGIAVRRGKPERLLESIVSEVALKYGRGERTVWSVWSNDALDFPFHKWFGRTAINSP